MKREPETRCIECGRPSDECIGHPLSMKALVAVAIQEAVKLALIDSAIPPRKDADGQDGFWTDEEKVEFRRDIFLLPGEAMARMDPVALAQNVCCRLLGTGGWYVNGVYSPNATPREVLEASLERPDQDHIAEIAFDMGLRPTEDGMFELPEVDDDDEVED